MSYWREGPTSTVIPPTLASYVVDQYNNIVDISFIAIIVLDNRRITLGAPIQPHRLVQGQTDTQKDELIHTHTQTHTNRQTHRHTHTHTHMHISMFVCLFVWLVGWLVCMACQPLHINVLCGFSNKV